MVAGAVRLILAYIADAPGIQHDVHLGAPRGAHMYWTPCWRVRVEADLGSWTTFPPKLSRPVMMQAEQALGTGQYIRTTFIFVVITPLIQQLLHHMLAHTRWGEQSTRVVRPHSRRRCGPSLRSPATDVAQPCPHVGDLSAGWCWVLGDRVWMDDAAGAYGAWRSNGRPFVRTARYARTIRTQPLDVHALAFESCRWRGCRVPVGTT